MQPTVEPFDDSGLRIVDPIENTQFEIQTPNPVTPTSSSTDTFQFPVSTAVEITTSAVQIPELTSIYVHNDGLANTFNPSDGTLAVDGPRILEINIAPTKLFLKTTTPATIQRRGETVVIDVSSPGRIVVGVRSLHDQPAGTITTTNDPEGAMRALSYLGSALKTTSPERSFPTLRGHPPLIEVGDEFDVPDGIENPDTGVRLELPPEYEYIYPATSLAYYLGAELVAGDRPRLVTDKGFAYPLDGPEGYEQTVGRVLRQTFLLDCITRTEGYYEVDLHERTQVEPRIDLDFAELYDRPLAERLPAYLSVPFRKLEDQIPAWTLTVDIDPDPSRLDVLPFVADDLAVVRTINLDSNPAEKPTAIDEFYGIEDTDPDPVDSDFVTPDPIGFDCIGHAWVGDHAPVGANKMTVDSLRRSLDADAEASPIEIHVVCNDPEMQDERVVSEYYQLNDRHQFNVELHTELGVDDLREVLAQPADFLHYIGHIDNDGLVCTDGHLDTRTLDDVSVKAFLLNACDSHEQGMGLVEAGSLGGIITLSNVMDSVANQAGTQFARLLAAGHTLRTSVTVLQKQLFSGTSWMTIGNGGLSVCQSKSGSPFFLRISRPNHEVYRTEVESYPSTSHGIGSAFGLFVNDTRYLVGGYLDTLDLNETELERILNRDLIPVDSNGERFWSNEVSVSDL